MIDYYTEIVYQTTIIQTKIGIRYGPTARTNPLTLHVMLAPVGVGKLICCSMYQQLAYVIVIVVFGC